MKNTKFDFTIAEITDVPTENFEHPFLTKVKFIFADNQGNDNKQGIEEDDFDMIAKSSINMPLKIRYTHAGAGGHEFSIPIGHMTSMYREDKENGVAQLVGEGVLYKEEYPDEVDYLKTAHEHGHAPGISWELAYQDSVSKAGIDWLKGVVTRAATFVRFPAYGNRTGLLAIAQNLTMLSDSQMMDQEFMDELKEIVDELNALVQGKPSEDDEEEDHQDELLMGGSSQNTGGNEVDEELQKAQAELEAALAKIAELTQQLETAQTAITDLTTENEGFKRQALIAERTAKIVEAGIKIESDQEKLAQKQELWLAMSPEIFDTYVTDLAEASKPATPPKDKAAASHKEGLPKFQAVAGTEQTLDDLKAMARRASRGTAADL